MDHLFNKETTAAILQRIDKLRPDSQRQWGKMTVGQMLAHCTKAMEAATGRVNPPRLMIGRVLGPFFKSGYLNEKLLGKNSPTDNAFIISDARDFEKERAVLVKIIKEFAEGGKDKCTDHPHSFFGHLEPEEWSRSQYKHLDHHLRQFGV